MIHHGDGISWEIMADFMGDHGRFSWEIMADFMGDHGRDVCLFIIRILNASGIHDPYHWPGDTGSNPHSNVMQCFANCVLMTINSLKKHHISTWSQKSYWNSKLCSCSNHGLIGTHVYLWFALWMCCVFPWIKPRRWTILLFFCLNSCHCRRNKGAQWACRTAKEVAAEFSEMLTNFVSTLLRFKQFMIWFQIYYRIYRHHYINGHTS